MSVAIHAPLPSPTALRLLGTARSTKPILGLARWSEDASDVALVLARPADGGEPSLEEILRQLPDPSTLVAGALVAVLGEVAPGGALLGRWLGRQVRVPRYLRSSALLAAGYARLGGGVDVRTRQDLAWGYVRSVASLDQA